MGVEVPMERELAADTDIAYAFIIVKITTNSFFRGQGKLH